MVSEGGSGEKKFDLEERTARFGEAVTSLARKIPVSPVTRGTIEQFIAAGTSVGANWSEAQDPESRKDFRQKVGICRKESREAKFWLRMIVAAVPELKPQAQALWQEAKELNLIFGSILRRTES